MGGGVPISLKGTTEPSPFLGLSNRQFEKERRGLDKVV